MIRRCIVAVVFLCLLAARAFAGTDLSDLALQPHPGARLPLDTRLRDDAGNEIALQSLLTGQPLVLVFDYLRCKTICGLALGSLAEAVGTLDKPPPVLAISIDPNDTPADAAAARVKYGVAGWHFLTGPEAAVRLLADAAGFRYRYDAATDQYIHSAAYIVLTADGAVSSYLPEPGITPRQLEAALATAASGDTTTPLTRILLLCFGGGAATGRYTPAIEIALIVLNLGGMAAAIVIFARRIWRREAEPR